VRIQAEGWYARILQHEIDHLHGRLYLDADAEPLVHERRQLCPSLAGAELGRGMPALRIDCPA